MADESEDWIITYADAITLLMAFFVLLLSVSDMNQGKFEQMKAEIVGEVAHKEVPKPYTELSKEAEEIFAGSTDFTGTEVQDTLKGINIELAGNALFQPGSAILKPASKKMLNELAVAILKLPTEQMHIEVEGHTDDTPISSPQFPSNWELSTNRATNVVRYLIGQGVPQEVMQASGFADTRPKVANRDMFNRPLPQNQEINRRIVIKIERPS